jgi:protein phosphatase
MKLSWAGLKDVGNKRNHQEDDLMMEGGHGVFAVFDGMGGGSSGEIASRLCASVMAVDVRLGELERGGLARLIHRCEEELREEQVRVHNPSVSTTVAALWARADGTLQLAHVGDSRVYRWRAGALEQLTEDHSLLNEYRKTHSLTQEQIDNFPHKNVIVRALCIHKNNEPVSVDISHDIWRPDDVYIVCTDGLFTDEGLIERVLKTDGGAPAAQLAQALMGAALAGPASDNIALVVVRLG